ncbi:MAG: hypothetical protein HEQ22_08480 [Sphingopyxis sp.]|uniref:hypothetical protein n=1 Tax=Sphingopyxis sp. TaxID=1908224 RepID=UPI003D80D66E
MQYDSQIQTMSDAEIADVNGGFFWIALPIIIGAGYTLGKDRATRDNARDENKKEA